MKIKLVVLDLELSRKTKRIAAAVAISLLVVGVTAVGFAAVPHTWNSGDTLTASDLNGNFSALDGRVAALEQAPVAPFGGWANAHTVLFGENLLLYPVAGVYNGYVPGEGGVALTAVQDWFPDVRPAFLLQQLQTSANPNTAYGAASMAFLNNPTGATSGTLTFTVYGDVAIYEAVGPVAGVGQGGSWTLAYHAYPGSTAGNLAGCTAVTPGTATIQIPATDVFRLAFITRGTGCADLAVDVYGMVNASGGAALGLTTDWAGLRAYTGAN